jgi:predicted nucleotidyltransferase
VRRIEKNRAGLKAPVFGELKMNKTMKKIVLLLVCVLLLQACEGNKFLESAAEKLNPSSPPLVVSMDWEPDNIYINPKDKSIDGVTGMITGTYRNGGKKIWFKKTSSLSQEVDWNLVSSAEESYPAGSITTILVANTSPSTHNGTLGTIITLNFAADTSAVESIINVDDGSGSTVISTAFVKPDEGGVKYSFILTPKAFTGAEARTVTDNLRHDFRLIMPSYAGYAKQALERFEYDSISVSWKAGSLAFETKYPGNEPTDGDIAVEMEVIAGSLAAIAVENKLKTIFTVAVDFYSDETSWKPSLASDIISHVISAGSGTVYPDNYELSPFKFTYNVDGSEAQAAIVVPVKFINDSPEPPPATQ